MTTAIAVPVWRTALVPAVLGVISLAALVWLAWPLTADADLRAAYAQLEHAPVPVEVVGFVGASDPRVQLFANGYALSIRAATLGDITISGQQGGSTAADNSLTWQTGEMTYALRTSADPQLVQARVVALDEARLQLGGSRWDTPVLYLFYLPALVAFAMWATWALLLKPPAR
ncbi:MAG TPA: hypothetical protein VKV73_24025 [Chloroflexota bacterium]|nr:hypothetical protein [Chloroflexota bacterium]